MSWSASACAMAGLEQTQADIRVGQDAAGELASISEQDFWNWARPESQAQAAAQVLNDVPDDVKPVVWDMVESNGGSQEKLVNLALKDNAGSNELAREIRKVKSSSRPRS